MTLKHDLGYKEGTSHTLGYFFRIDVKAGRKDFYLVIEPESSNC